MVKITVGITVEC